MSAWQTVAMVEDGGSGPVLDTLTVLFTDLVGSTELRARLGEDTAEVVRRAHDSLIAGVVDTHGGRMIKGLGDGFMATFASAARAVAAAVAIQQGIDASLAPAADVKLEVRIGVSVGDVSVEDGDVFGTPVIEAARLCALADGGQILAASVVETLARRRDGHDYVDKGALELKGLPDPVSTVEVVWERLDPTTAGVIFPPPLTVREGTFPFSGRADTVDQLLGTWKRCLHDGISACVLISGEPGMGKTRLSSEFARRAHDGGAMVLFGRCDEELAIPYQPFVEALTHYASGVSPGDVESLGPHPAELGRLVPDLRAVFPEMTELTASGDAEVDQFRLFEAVDGWLESAARASGLILVLDDVHWAAKPTLLLLRHVLRSGPSTPIMIVATYRDTDLDRTHPLSDLLADLRRSPEVQRLALSGLDRSGVEELMAAASQQDLDEAAHTLAAAVHAETEGNPFFVGELLRHLIESGALVHDGIRWVGSTSVDEMAIPDGIREVVGRRLSRLSSDANEVLAWSAVLGRELRLDVLARVAGGEDRCVDAMDEAVDARLVDEAGAGRWRFAHALVRSTLLAELRTTRRVRMHLSVAEAFEDVAPDELAALAQHFAEAAPLGAGDKAVSYLLQAGAAALETLAFDQADDLHVRALDIIEDLGLDLAEQRADAAYGVAVARRWTGGDFEPAIDRACDLAAAIGDGPRLAKVLLDTSRGFVARVFEVVAVSVAHHEQCLALLPEGDSRERALITASLSVELLYGEDQAQVLALSDEAEAMARRLADRETLSRVLFAVGIVNSLPERAHRSSGLVDEFAGLIDASGTPKERASYALVLCGQAASTGERSMFSEGLDRLSAVADQVRRSYKWQLTAARGGYELRFGDLAVAERLAKDLLREIQETGEQDGLLWYGNLVGFTLRQQGRTDEGAALNLSIVEDHPQAAAVAEPLYLLHLCEGEHHGEARDRAPDLFAWGQNHPSDATMFPDLGTLALVAAELGDEPAARWLLERLTPFDGWWSCWGSNGAIAPISTILGRLNATIGDLATSDGYFDRAIAHCRDQQAWYFLADALLHQGRSTLAHRHDALTAAPLLQEALLLATAGGFNGIKRRAEASLDLAP